jgi:ssDNA-binding Zn-finger/Zn-ribbon topoisomerase 1
MRNLDKAELKPCPVCGGKAEHRFNIYKYQVWACGCWKHEKPVYSNSPNHQKAIENWNNGINIIGADQKAEEDILI